MAFDLAKCRFALKEWKWPLHKITPIEVMPLFQKTDPIEALKPLRTLSHLKLFMVSKHTSHKYLPALTE